MNSVVASPPLPRSRAGRGGSCSLGKQPSQEAFFHPYHSRAGDSQNRASSFGRPFRGAPSSPRTLPEGSLPLATQWFPSGILFRVVLALAH